jgi:hypothetical protein
MFPIFLVGWSLYTKRLLHIGLMKANMHAYFDARWMGVNHQEAILKVIKYRYPFSQEERAFVKSMFDKISQSDNEKGHLKALIYVMHCHEANRPPKLNSSDKVLLKIERIYDSINSRYMKGNGPERNH